MSTLHLCRYQYYGAMSHMCHCDYSSEQLDDVFDCLLSFSIKLPLYDCCLLDMYWHGSGSRKSVTYTPFGMFAIF